MCFLKLCQQIITKLRLTLGVVFSTLRFESPALDLMYRLFTYGQFSDFVSYKNKFPIIFRIKSTSLKDLQDMIARPIRILNNIKIHSTLQDRFLDVFKEQVALNPTVDMDFQVRKNFLTSLPLKLFKQIFHLHFTIQV